VRNSSGLRKSWEILSGEFTFQFSDGRYVGKQNSFMIIMRHGLMVALDVEGTDNNMNEEWFGICAKGPTNARGL
jgi:hypothetical protein